MEITCRKCGLLAPDWFRRADRFECQACKAIRRHPNRDRPPFTEYRAQLMLAAESKYLRRYCGKNKCQSCQVIHSHDPTRRKAWQHLCHACERLSIRVYRHAAKARNGYDAGKRIRNALLRGGGSPKVEDMIGYSIGDLRHHLGLQLLKGMTWDNMADWHIDHIVSQAEWRASGDPDWWVKSWQLSNLRPMWGPDNVSKGAKRIFLL